MMRFATLFIFMSLLAVGGKQTSAAAQDQPRAGARLAHSAEQPTGSAEIAGSTSGQDTGQTAPSQSVMERLPPKIHKIQQELPVWIQNGGDQAKATALMQKLQAQLNAKNFEEAEKTADSVLELIGANTQGSHVTGQDIPEEAKKRLRHDLSFSFLVYRDRIQQELKLTSAQKAQLDQFLRKLLPEAIPFFHKIDGLQPEERERELAAYRPKALAKLEMALKATLNESQLKRLRQLVRQREGLFGGDESWKDLHVTDEQRQQFMAVIQQTQQKMAPLLASAQNGGNPREIRPRVIQMRVDLEARLEALLTNAQQKQWKEMLGKSMDINALFDM